MQWWLTTLVPWSRFLWATTTKATGWTVPAVGKAGPIKHSSGLCISAEPSGQGGSPAMKPCSSGSREQQWVLESNGNLHAAVADNKLCLAVENGEGPAVPPAH